MLEDIGFFELLDIQLARRREKVPGSYVRMARFKSGTLLEPEVIGPFVDILIDQFLMLDPDALLDEERRKGTLGLFGALVEATENTRIHAYTDEMKAAAECAPRWWLTGAVDPKEKKLTLVVYDQGVTIPGRLNMPEAIEWGGFRRVIAGLRRLFGANIELNDPAMDHAVLRFAMGYGRSSTNQKHRGKGLPAIEEVARRCRHGRLLVQSRRGEYIYNKGSKSLSRLLPEAIPGTLIVWDLWL